MANKYANLVGTNKIKDEYTKINIGFDGVETDIDALNDRVDALDSRVDTIITTPIDGEAAAQELVDARAGFPTIGDRMTKIEEDIETHKTDYASNAIKKDGSVAMTGTLVVRNTNSINVRNGDALSYFDVDFPQLQTQRGILRFFRITNTTGDKSFDLCAGDGTSSIKFQIANGEISCINGNFVYITSGTGSPEGVVNKPMGSLYLRVDVGELYIKTTSTGNTGWKKVETE